MKRPASFSNFFSTSASSLWATQAENYMDQIDGNQERLLSLLDLFIEDERWYRPDWQDCYFCHGEMNRNWHTEWSSGNDPYPPPIVGSHKVECPIGRAIVVIQAIRNQ